MVELEKNKTLEAEMRAVWEGKRCWREKTYEKFSCDRGPLHEKTRSEWKIFCEQGAPGGLGRGG